MRISDWSSDVCSSDLLGLSHQQLGQPQAAIDALRKALQIAPGLAAAWQGLGESHLAIKDYPSAIDALRKAVQIDPGSAEAWFHLGNGYLGSKDYPDAVDALQTRSEERRVGQGGVRTCRFGWWPVP